MIGPRDPPRKKKKVAGGGMPPDVLRLRWDHGIEVEGNDVPRPVTTFAESGLNEDILSKIHSKGWQTPTPIQMQGLSCAMMGRDVVGMSPTGSGKTLAYVAPLCMLLPLVPPAGGGGSPTALVLVPTRELADQVWGEVAYFLEGAAGGHRAVGLVGGVPIGSQLAAMRHGADAIVATPGRLLDVVRRGAVSLAAVRYLVVDEVDRMLTLDMEEQVTKVIDACTRGGCPRQTLLFSATVPRSLDRLIRRATVDPITVRVTSDASAGTVTQHVYFMQGYEREHYLLHELRRTPRPPAIVFCNSKERVEEVTRLLRTEQFHVAPLHSERNQAARFRAIKAFKDEQCDVLVTTDLASRGIDVPDVSHVINYDIPPTIEAYVHRIGRTGRMGSSGRATSFLTLGCEIAAELRAHLELSLQAIPRELEDPDLLQKFGKRHTQ